MQKESVVVPSHKWSSVLKRERASVWMWERVREGAYPRMGACECARVWVHACVREREGEREQARVASMFINNLLHHWLSYSFIHPLTSGEFEAAETEKEKRLLLQYFMKKICSVFSGKRNWNPQGEILKNGQVIEAHQQYFRKLHWSKKRERGHDGSLGWLHTERSEVQSLNPGYCLFGDYQHLCYFIKWRLIFGRTSSELGKESRLPFFA